MSTNAVLCVTDGKHTVRLTKYRCKPPLFLKQLADRLASAAELTMAQVTGILSNNGFEQEADLPTPFKATEWCGEKERSEGSGDFFSAEAALRALGIAITNFEQSEFYNER